MNKWKQYGILDLILIVLTITLILTLCSRNKLIAEHTEAYRELTHETENLTKQYEKTNDLLIEQNTILNE